MSDLISREQAIWAIEDYDEYAYYQTRRNIESIPSADIMECARALKRHCINTKDCKECFMWDECKYELSAPCNWDLPTPWADDSIF